MVIPELRSIHSPDLSEDAIPEDPRNCQILIQGLIGPKGELGEESFDFVVVTPTALTQLVGHRWGHGLLLVESFDWGLIRTAVDKILRHCEGETWEEVANKIGRYFSWEFDGYKGA